MNKHGFDSIVVYSITAYSFFVNKKYYFIEFDMRSLY